MGRVGGGEHSRARGDALLGQAVMHVGGRQQAEADVMMLGVVPGEEDVGVACALQEPAGRARRPLAGRPESRVQSVSARHRGSAAFP